jgi:5'-nucleotidase (lipoprotein e(P4) family)
LRAAPAAARFPAVSLAAAAAGRSLLASLALAALAGCAATAPAPAPPTAAAAAATAAEPSTFEGLDAALWIQSAEEARLLREMVYAAARRALAEALADPARGALDAASAEPRPPAAILDLDETVLDNSPYNAWLTVRGERFGPRSWSAWVEAAQATAVPGALEFARAASELGVTLFYVSNRDAPMEAATRRNLAALGLPLADAHDVVLLRYERPEWGTDKSSRYDEVARTHRVLVLVGDDLNDFVPVPRDATPASRRALVEPHRRRFGRDWFLLPNPVHGSWMRAAVAGSAAPADAGESKRKIEALDVFALEAADTPP